MAACRRVRRPRSRWPRRLSPRRHPPVPSSGFSCLENLVRRRGGREQRYETFGQRWMTQNRITQCGVGQPRDHGDLDGGEYFPRTDTEGGEPEDAIAVSLDEGKHAMFGHDSPMYLRSTTATFLPSPAKVHAATVEPVPPPRITRSNSSGCVFMRFFLSERPVHSGRSLISPGRPLTLPRATVQSRLLARCVLSRTV